MKQSNTKGFLFKFVTQIKLQQPLHFKYSNCCFTEWSLLHISIPSTHFYLC